MSRIVITFSCFHYATCPVPSSCCLELTRGKLDSTHASCAFACTLRVVQVLQAQSLELQAAIAASYTHSIMTWILWRALGRCPHTTWDRSLGGRSRKTEITAKSSSSQTMRPPPFERCHFMIVFRRPRHSLCVPRSTAQTRLQKQLVTMSSRTVPHAMPLPIQIHSTRCKDMPMHVMICPCQDISWGPHLMHFCPLLHPGRS